MVLSGKIEALVYKKKKKEFGEGNQITEYYRVIIDIDDEVEELPCSKEAFEQMIPGKVQALAWNYNTKAERNAFKIVGIAQVQQANQPNEKGGK